MTNVTKFNTAPIRLITADDHTMVRTGLQMILELKFSITNIYEAGSCAEVLSAIKQHKPTHLIIDMIFKDGNAIEILPTITRLAPQINILVYSMLPAEIYHPALQKFGIRYYLNKESTQQKTLQILDNFLYRNINTTPQENSDTENSNNIFKCLSVRELEVLHYLLKGETVNFAATELNLHKNTISTLKSRIMEKIGVKNLKGLLDIAALYNYNG